MNFIKKKSPAKYIWISIAASITTILIKGIAYYLTDSVSLLSDALESFINLAAAIMALVLITIASNPPDKEHPFGHHKAEYFSSVIEGGLILLAAIAIGVTSLDRLFNPRILHYLGIGVLVSAGASLINLSTAIVLLKAGKRYNSITLEADARHLITDVWTTGGVIIGLILVKFTGWIIIDPIIALLVAINIVITGIKLITRSVSGLMDKALSEDKLNAVKEILDKYKCDRIIYHSLYTRTAASKNFIFFHLLMPCNWHISRGHEITKKIENEIKTLLENSDVFIHIEPLNDSDAFDDYLD
ncbi:MAG: cation transporter [Spirochaetes bacterium]|nr:cation transporter [Spirochaetota bacterium]